MLHLPPSEVNAAIKLHTKTTTSSTDWEFIYITYVICSLCINGQHKNDYELRTMTAALPKRGTIYGHLLPMFHSSVFNSKCTEGHKNSYMPGSNILSKHEYICLKIGNLCSLNNRSMTAFSVYSYEIFYISFQPHDRTFLMKTTSTSQHSSWTTAW
jgi:hypothetical protein